MAEHAPAEHTPFEQDPLTWRTWLRGALRFGAPLLGVWIFGAAVVASVGGDIRPGRFALGVALVLLAFAASLVTGR